MMTLLQRLTAALLAILLLPCLPVWAQPENELAVELSPLVKRLLEDDLLTEAQRREAMMFHGQWDKLGALSQQEELKLAVGQYRVDLETLQRYGSKLLDGVVQDADPQDVLELITALYAGGRPEDAIKIQAKYRPTLSVSGKLQLAMIYEDLGQYPQAIEQLAPLREQAQKDIKAFTTAEDLTAAAEAIVMLAKLEGRPAADYHLAVQLLGKAHEEIDPLYWPAYVAEARLLFDKGNPQQAMEAVVQALSLNPKSSEAWYLLGSMRTRYFDFDSGNKALAELRAINPQHPLADALAVEIALRQMDVDAAKAALGPALTRYPTHRQLLALNAAVAAMSYDDKATAQAIAAFEQLAPGNPQAHFAAGQALSDKRQYALAEPFFKDAIAKLPGWSQPQLALGAMYMQWGKLDEAAVQLRIASTLDPFHKEITNQLTLVQEMLGYETLESGQFLIRYKPGIDEVLARDMTLHMNTMAQSFIARFAHDPPAVTQVDIMPDDQHFAVRITGMPDIWTIAACMGDVLAMTPPRPGPQRAYGAYNWLNVLGHEYAHVIHLSQTHNRVAHWFTEGAAVRMETTGWLWDQYTLLSRCYNTNELFTYDNLNWGFIRPTQPHHRSLAYAQSAWIIQYIDEVHGWDKALAMLNLYRDGVSEKQTIQQVFGTDTDTFMKGFMDWAGKQVAAWGMSTYGIEPKDAVLQELLHVEDLSAVDRAQLDQAIKDHPGEPDLLRIKAQIALAGEDQQAAIEAIRRYQQARPVDPWSDRELARLAIKAGDAESALASLLTLDRIEGDAPEYAVELARVYRGRKDYDRALYFAERALLREPYNPTFREMAATIAVQMSNLDRAAFHVQSLEMLEPQRAIHPKRLAVIYERLGQKEQAEAARKRADTLELLKDD